MKRKTTQDHEIKKPKFILQIPTDVWMYCVIIFCDLESLKTLRFVFSEKIIHPTHWKKSYIQHIGKNYFPYGNFIYMDQQ